MKVVSKSWKDLAATLAKTNPRAPIAISTPSFQNYLISVFKILKHLAVIQSNRLCAPLCGFIQAPQFEFLSRRVDCLQHRLASSIDVGSSRLLHHQRWYQCPEDHRSPCRTWRRHGGQVAVSASSTDISSCWLPSYVTFPDLYTNGMKILGCGVHKFWNQGTYGSW